MMFLDIFDIDPMGWFREILFDIAIGMYKLVALVYNLFDKIAKVNIFDGDNYAVVAGIYKRVQAILVIVMVFYLIFQFVQYILQPEAASDKQKGVEGSVKKIVVVVLLMAFTPTIFNLSYKLKNIVLNTSIIEKVILGDGGASNTTIGDDIECGSGCTNGGKFAAKTFGMFVNPSDGFDWETGTGGDDNDSIRRRLDIVQGCIAGGNCQYNLSWGLSSKIDGRYVIDFDWLIAVPAGFFIIYVLFLYCIEVGRMVFQFAFLQLIAPVPIMSYLSSNKENMFNKWTKQCVTTYIDVFLRLFIINFVFLLIAIIYDLDLTPFGLFKEPLAWVFLVLGLMLFAAKAPALIKELLPKGGGAAAGGFGVGKKSAAASTLLGATRGTARALGRTARGLYKAGSAAKTGIDLKRRNGKGFRSQLKNHVATAFYRGVNNAGERLNSYLGRRNQTKEEYKKSLDELSNAIDEAEKIGYRKSVKNKALAQKAKAELDAAEYEKNDLISQLNNVNNKIERRKLLSSKTNLTKEERVELDELNNQNLVEKQRKVKSSLEKVENKIQKSAANVSNNLGVSNYTRASNEYEQAVRELKDAKQSGDSTRIKNAESNLKEKKEILKNVERENDGNAIQTLFAAQEELEAAKKLPADAKDREKIISDAKNKVDSAQKAFSDEKRKILNMDVEKYLGSTVVDRVEEAKQEVKQKREEMNNIGLGVSERIGASGLGNLARGVSDVVKPLTNVAGGIVKNYIDDTIGNVTGAYKGAQTADITKVAADNKKYVDELRKREEFIAAGGDPGIINTVKTKVSSFASDYLGVPSANEKIVTETKSLQNRIKENDLVIKNQQKFSTAFDNSKKAAASIREKHKLNWNPYEYLKESLFSDDVPVEIYEDDTGEKLNERYIAKVNAATSRHKIASEKSATSYSNLGELGSKYSSIKDSINLSVDSPNYYSALKKAIENNFEGSEKDMLIEHLNNEMAENTAQSDLRVAEQHLGQVQKMIDEAAVIKSYNIMAETDNVLALDKAGLDSEMNVSFNEFLTGLQVTCSNSTSAQAAIDAVLTLSPLTGREIPLLQKRQITKADLIGIDLKTVKNLQKAMEVSMSKLSSDMQVTNQQIEELKIKESDNKRNLDYFTGDSSGGK